MPFQQKWVAKLLGFDYEIQYKQGVDNSVADALSRVHGSPVLPGNHLPSSRLSLECTSISYPYFGWLDDLKRSLENDPWVS